MISVRKNAVGVAQQRCTDRLCLAEGTSLEGADVKAQFKTAIRAAQKRAAELGEEFGRG